METCLGLSLDEADPKIRSRMQVIYLGGVLGNTCGDTCEAGIRRQPIKGEESSKFTLPAVEAGSFWEVAGDSVEHTLGVTGLVVGQLPFRCTNTISSHWLKTAPWRFVTSCAPRESPQAMRQEADSWRRGGLHRGSET